MEVDILTESLLAGSAPATAQAGRVRRIGVLLCARRVNEAALRFLVVCMNRQQTAFQYEFLPFPHDDEFLAPLWDGARVDREEARGKVAAFCQRYRDYLTGEIEEHRLKEAPPDYFVVVTTARLTGNYYSMRQGGELSILALGDWKRWMAPPSLLEFVLTLLLRESVAAVSKSLRGSVHLGTKGCLCDFNPDLSDVRQKVLAGFVCSYCRTALAADGLLELAAALEKVLEKEWLGSPTDAGMPAGIAANLGYDLFVTKGLKATPWEAFKSTLRQEGATQLATVVGGLLFAGLIVLLGLK